MKIAVNYPSISLISSVVFVIVLIVVLRGLDLDTQLVGLLQRVEETGAVGVAVFMVVVCLFVVLMLPSVLLTLGAGALYGVVPGSLAIVLAETVGATVAFFLGRTALRNKVQSLMTHRPKLQRTLNVLRKHDWQLVAMLRMIPFFPFKLSNYLMGVTPVTTGTYFKGTFIGLWPISLFNVYLGSLANDLMSLEQSGRLQTPAQWAMALTGLALSAVIVFFAVRRATVALSDMNSTRSDEG